MTATRHGSQATTLATAAEHANDLETCTEVSLAIFAGSKLLFDDLYEDITASGTEAMRSAADRYSWLMFALDEQLQRMAECAVRQAIAGDDLPRPEARGA